MKIHIHKIPTFRHNGKRVSLIKPTFNYKYMSVWRFAPTHIAQVNLSAYSRTDFNQPYNVTGSVPDSFLLELRGDDYFMFQYTE